MSSKSDKNGDAPKLKAKVLNPKRTRRKKFDCCSCSYCSYSARDYKILYEARKVMFFQFPASSRKVYCHECFYQEVARRIPISEDEIKIEILDTAGSYILCIEAE